MRQEGRLGYARGEGYQAVELPYDGGEMAMAIMLPHAGSFSEFEGLLDASMVDGVLEDLETRRVLLTMPKFEVRDSFGLADTLEAMGMPNAFDERAADFSGLDGTSCLAGDDGCLLIADVVHQAFVSVDEAGTEAAAATAAIVGITRAAVEPVTPLQGGVSPLALGRAASHASISDSGQRTARTPIFSGSRERPVAHFSVNCAASESGTGLYLAKAQEAIGSGGSHDHTPF